MNDGTSKHSQAYISMISILYVLSKNIGLGKEGA